MNKLFQEILATMGIYRSNEDRVYGVLAEFANPGELLRAARETRRAGYRKFDTHSPFPIHGMDRAMGLGQSKLGWIVFFGGTAVGFALGVWLQWWTGGVDYPLNISGKPFYALEPSVPIIFELTILLSALAAVAGMLALNGLPRPYNPLFYSRRFMRASDDGFFLHVAANDSRFEVEAVQQFLKDLGATYVEVIEDHEVVDTGPVASEAETAPTA